MYKIKIIEKSGAFCEYQFKNVDDCNPTDLGHGLPERVVIADGNYDPADVIEEIPAVTETRTRTVIVPAQEIIDENGNSNIIPEQEVVEEYQEIITPAMVRLRSEYQIEVVDISSEVLEQKRKAYAAERNKVADQEMLDRLALVTNEQMDFETHLALAQQANDKILFPEDYTEEEVLEARMLRAAYKQAWSDILSIRQQRDMDIQNYQG